MAEQPQAGLRALLDAGVLSVDPMPWLLASEEPYAVLNALVRVLGRPDDDPRVEVARAQMLADEGVRALIAELPERSEDLFPGHHSPQFVPNRLNLLADMGVRAGDEARIDALLDAMLARQDPDGRLQSFERLHGSGAEADWHVLLCDTNAITDIMHRFGRGADPRVRVALGRVLDDVSKTPQGRAWQCAPDPKAGFRGPASNADVCPQVTLEGLRAASELAVGERPEWLPAAARTPLEVWRRRTDERPHAFGHGYQFKSVKWPNFWYDVLWVLETVGRFPELWNGPAAREDDRRALAEMAACLVAYNFDSEGRVVPRRTYEGFERYSFGQKQRPSPFATARSLVALVRLAELAEEIASVDVLALPSSKRGALGPVPPKGGGDVLAPCPLPTPSAYPADRALQRVLVRQHLDVAWETLSLESVVADVVALPHAEPASPYLSMQARLPGFTRASLDSALYVRRSLVRYRCMRGQVFVVRRGLLEVVQAATSRAVVRYAQRFVEHRGITPAVYEALAPRVLDLLHEEPLTTRGLADRLEVCRDIGADIGAVVTLMSAEGLLLRDRPLGGWLDRQPTWVPFADVLPELRLNALDELEARRRLLIAYVRGFGPVTLRDAAWWTGRAPEHVRRAIERLEDEIVEVRLSDSEETYFMHAADTDELERSAVLESPSVALLPAYDALTMGYADRSRLLADEIRPYVFDRSNNVTSVVLVDGRVAGVWDLTERPEPTVLVHLFGDVSGRVRDAIEEKAGATGVFRFDEPARVEFLGAMPELANRPAAAVARPLRVPVA